MEKIKSILKKRKNYILVLSCMVVFVTTYVLILPAITLDQDEAEKQGGIDLPGQTQINDDGDAVMADEADITDPAKEEAAAEPSEEAAAQPAEEKAAAKSDQTKEPLLVENRDYTISVDAAAADLPDKTKLVAAEINSKDKDYKQLYKDALKAVQKDSDSRIVDFRFAKFYDISLMDGNDSIEPDKAVSVTISYEDAIKAEDSDHIRIVHFAVDENTGEVKAEVLDPKHVDTEIKNKKLLGTSFEAESFSVFAVVYTVDFEYDVDGNKYEFSMEGGSTIKLQKLLTELNVIKDNEDTDVDEIQLFMDDIKTVVFSDPELIRVKKTDGEWTLRSLEPFTSEETLTITMKDGSEFLIRVTDAQEIDETDSIDVNNSYIISTIGPNGQYYVLKTDGTTAGPYANTSGFDRLGPEYQWTFYYVFTEKDRETSMDYAYYFLRPITDKSKTLALNEAGETLVQEGTNNVAVIPQDNGGFVFLGYNHSEDKHIELGFQNWNFTSFNDISHNPTIIRVFQQDPLPTYSFTVKTDDPDKGKVSGQDENNQNRNNVNEFIAATNNAKVNNHRISANVVNHINQGQQKYMFDYWDLNGERLEGVGAAINPHTLPIPYNGSVLTAHFKQNPAYVVPDSEKEGTPTNHEELQAWINEFLGRDLPLEEAATKKTAEVYDYENRIYRVDLTSKANLQTFDGTIDLGFIIDVSGSMNFPSLLYNSSAVTGVRDLSHINDRRWNGDTTQGQRWGLNTQNTYYIITDPEGTATVCYLYYYQNNWWLCDASKDKYNGNGRFDPANGHSADNTQWYNNSYYKTTSYVIMEAGDRVTWADYNDPTDGPLLRKLGLNVGDPKTRAFYLEKSLNGTIGNLDEILNLLSIASDGNENPDVKIAWNTFKNYLPDGDGQRQPIFESATGGINLNYDKNTYGGGTSTDAALLDAAGVNRNDIQNRYSDDDRKRWDTDNNVNHTYTLDPSTGFQWENGATKYAVLITDGAPQRSSRSITRRYVTEAAQQLKNRGVNLVTVGLGMDNVVNGKILLYDIADKTTDTNEQLFYSAKSGDELEDVLYDIIRKILTDATVRGDINDTINEAFYPVDKTTGKLLDDGDKIDLEGNLITGTPDGPYGVIIKNDNGRTYSVKWENQDIPVGDGWHGTVFVKAREDFLGGNAVKTNQSASVEAKAYTTDTDDPNPHYIDITDDNDKLPNRYFELPTPLVNVNELNLLQNSTEWTVYLGSEVDPKEELKRLYDKILVEEVVNDAIDTDDDIYHTPDIIDYNGANSHHYQLAPNDFSDTRSGQGQAATFKFGDLILELLEEPINAELKAKYVDNNGKLKWDEFLEDALNNDDGIQIPYHRYGLDDESYIEIKVTKDIVSPEEADLINNSPHETTVTGNAVEKYTLDVFYSPDYHVLPKGQGGNNTANFRVGTYGTMYQGHGAGTETSTNEHVINVFVKGLQIRKTDLDKHILLGAEFKLYRTARDSDTDAVTVDGLPGTYVVVDELASIKTTGVALIEQIKNLNADEQYYLVETKAPEGYHPITPIEVSLNITDKYIPKPGETEQSTLPADGPYSWVQQASLTLDDNSVAIRTDESGEEDLGHTGVTANTDSDIVYYSIPNNFGYELPEAGGSGTTWIYLLGSILLLGCGTILIARRRSKI